jgi:hypothetical protein
MMYVYAYKVSSTKKLIACITSVRLTHLIGVMQPQRLYLS